MELLLEKLSKNYGDNVILKDLDLQLTPGIYGLLGANGAGKTTLFKTICGILSANTGTIKYNGENVKQDFKRFLSILGYLPQDFTYYSEFSGLKFMLYMAALKGVSKNTAKKMCLELLDLVGLSAESNKRIKKYSGGMKQRLGIAQALINDPEILILDEPTVGLDPKERVRFRNLISSFSDNKIVILSTHIVSDIEYIADEIILLKKGTIIDTGTPQKLVKEIENCVWEIEVETRDVQQLSQNLLISNQKYKNDKTILRTVSVEEPLPAAKRVPATLEDLYLYHFREEAS